MPWDLLFDDGTRRRLYPGTYLIGRKAEECSIAFPDDKSIRRAAAAQPPLLAAAPRFQGWALSADCGGVRAAASTRR